MESNSFIESLGMILDESNQFSIMMEDTYYIHEFSLSEYIKKIDFKKIFKFIFDKFVGILKTIWDRFKAAYNAFTNKSVLIKRYKKQLENINWDVEIDEERSMFMNLDISTHINMYKLNLNSLYSTLIQELEKISNTRNIGDIHTVILDIKNNSEPTDTYLDQIRGESIGSRSSITKEDYPREVTNYFCPESKITANVIHPSETKLYVREYFESKSLEKVITADESILRSTANNMNNKINSLRLERYIPDQQINPEIATDFVQIIRNYCDKCQGICNIYIQLFSIKLDIFKLYKEQQVRILSKIILKSMKEGKI
jgi:hypothetical protein